MNKNEKMKRIIAFILIGFAFVVIVSLMFPHSITSQDVCIGIVKENHTYYPFSDANPSCYGIKIQVRPDAPLPL